MRISHVNVRLAEGGAANMMLALHHSLISEGIKSNVAYGYGPGGRRSAQHEELSALQLTTASRAAGNLLLHNLIGVDLIPAGRSELAKLRGLVEKSDLVHLHAIHSHFTRYRQLLRLIRDTGKPVVWTMHDAWALTGRCAIPGGCRAWMGGCGNCPDLHAYPATSIDISGAQWISKREAINQLPNLTIAVPSQWLAEDFRTAFPGQTIHTIPNGVDPRLSRAFQALASGHVAPERRFLIVGADLSDKRKQDHDLLQRVINTTNINVVTVGRKSPFHGDRVQNLGPIGSRQEMAEIYSSASMMLFTSQVDNYPTVVLESLAGGTPVLALPSPGCQEILNRIDASAARDQADFLERAQSHALLQDDRVDRRALAQLSQKIFSFAATTAHYIRLYRTLAPTA